MFNLGALQQVTGVPMHLDMYGYMSHPSDWYAILLAWIVYFWNINPSTPGVLPVELWSPACSRWAWFGILSYFYSMQIKALGLGIGQFVGETLPASPQKFQNHSHS